MNLSTYYRFRKKRFVNCSTYCELVVVQTEQLVDLSKTWGVLQSSTSLNAPNLQWNKTNGDDLHRCLLWPRWWHYATVGVWRNYYGPIALDIPNICKTLLSTIFLSIFVNGLFCNSKLPLSNYNGRLRTKIYVFNRFIHLFDHKVLGYISILLLTFSVNVAR